MSNANNDYELNSRETMRSHYLMLGFTEASQAMVNVAARAFSQGHDEIAFFLRNHAESLVTEGRMLEDEFLKKNKAL